MKLRTKILVCFIAVITAPVLLFFMTLAVLNRLSPAPIMERMGQSDLREIYITMAVVLLLAATAVLAAMTISGNSFKSRSRDQYAQAMSNNAANALSVANRMDSVTVSTTSQRLGLIRQYIYAMEQVNRLSIQMFGEGGRYVPDNAFTALYQDLDNYETVVQSAKVSTVEVRELLINHLKLVQGYINGDIVS